MSENICEFQKEHIEDISDLKARMKTVENVVSDMSDMKENLKILTVLQQKQEERDLRLDKIMESQNEINIETRLALQDITTNLKHMNEKYDDLKCEFKNSESKNTLDIRDIEKEKVKLSFKQKAIKFGIPFGAISGFIVALVELAKGLKWIK